MICVVCAVVTPPFCCLKVFHKWQSLLVLMSAVESALLPLHMCDKGKAEACTLAHSACPAVKGKVTLGHTKLPALGFEALWVLFCPGWCPLSVRKEACVWRDEKGIRKEVNCSMWKRNKPKIHKEITN